MNLRLVLRTMAVVGVAALGSACATGRAYSRGLEAAKAGDWDAAVGFYRQALQDDPDRPDYKTPITSETMVATSPTARLTRAP